MIVAQRENCDLVVNILNHIYKLCHINLILIEATHCIFHTVRQDLWKDVEICIWLRFPVIFSETFIYLWNPSPDFNSHPGDPQIQNHCEMNQGKNIRHNYSAVFYLSCGLVDSISVARLKLISCCIPFPNTTKILSVCELAPNLGTPHYVSSLINKDLRGRFSLAELLSVYVLLLNM